MKERKEISNEFKWKLEDIFKTEEDFLNKLDELTPLIDEFTDEKDKFVNFVFDKNQESVDYIYDLYTKLQNMSIDIRNCSTWVNCNYDSDKSDSNFDTLKNKVVVLSEKISLSLEYVSSTMKNIDDEILRYYQFNDTLKDFNLSFKSLIEDKERIFDELTETKLTLSSSSNGGFCDAYDTFTTCDQTFPTVEIEGEEVELNPLNFRKYRESSNKEIRNMVQEKFWENQKKSENLFAKLLHFDINGGVKQAKIRNYDTSLERALSGDHIDPSVYKSFIKKMKEYLPHLHEYLKFKKEEQGLDTLSLTDLYSSIVPEDDKEWTYDEAKEINLKAVEILGDEYKSIFEKAFNDGWIDVYPNKSKDSGAYMNGSSYTTHPFVLMNYNERFDDLSTLGHELGHAAHSYFSNKTQPSTKASYSTFIAEIASTTIQLLINEYMLKQDISKELRMKVFESTLGDFRSTVFRQTLFAEFELFMHEEVEKGNLLTPDLLNKKYLELLKEYYGHDEGIVNVPDFFEIEWSYIPHFYYDFYMWQYATSYLNSVVFASRILKGDSEKFIELLKSGCKDDPIELLKEAGIDFTKNDLYEDAFGYFDEILKKLKDE
jgi:oligoendopeptidase F